MTKSYFGCNLGFSGILFGFYLGYVIYYITYCYVFFVIVAFVVIVMISSRFT